MSLESNDCTAVIPLGDVEVMEDHENERTLALLPSSPEFLPSGSPSCEDDTDLSLVVRKKQRKTLGSIPTITKAKPFVTYHADRGSKHGYRFQLLPASRYSTPKYAIGCDKLTECIRSGGGKIENVGGDGALEESNGYTIKILDLEFIRENIHSDWVQDMLLPYDCFSSNFIWSQVFHRSSSGVAGRRNADLNLFRISPSRYTMYDANQVLNGTLSWDVIPLMPMASLAGRTELLQVALLLFPELMVFPSRTRRVYLREESQCILDTVCKLNAHGQVNGCSLYVELAKNHFNGRSSTSLREHFRKTILPHVLAQDKYYLLSQEDVKKFKEADAKSIKKAGRRIRKRNKRLQLQLQPAE